MHRFKFVASLAILCAVVAFASPAEARRGRSSSNTPWVNTPNGPIPKSVYYADVLPPDQLMRFRAAEEAYMKKHAPKGSSTTTKKPTTTTKKK
jgi:hypothetical protein